MSMTQRIRHALGRGALNVKELSVCCGLPTTAPLHPYLHQMRERTREIVALPGQPKRYALRRQHTALQEEWR